MPNRDTTISYSHQRNLGDRYRPQPRLTRQAEPRKRLRPKSPGRPRISSAAGTLRIRTWPRIFAQADSYGMSALVSLAPSTARRPAKEVGQLSSPDATQQGWFKRNAEGITRWSERSIFLGACAIGIHRVYQHAFIHASLWFAVGAGGTLIHIADARRARHNARRARQHQLQALAALFREVTQGKTPHP